MAIEDLFKIVKERFVAEQPAVPASQEGDVEIPQDLLFKCPRCGAVVYNREFTAAMKVCPKCSYHARLTWQERLELTADKDSFVELDADMKSLNPIGFPKYEDKIAKMQQQCDMNDAIKTGVCTIRGYRTVIGIMDSHFFMASMGSVVGEKIARAFEYATEHNLPVVMFTSSGGARMQEGIISLMQMAKTSGAVKRHSDAGGLYISVMTTPPPAELRLPLRASATSYLPSRRCSSASREGALSRTRYASGCPTTSSLRSSRRNAASLI